MSKSLKTEEFWVWGAPIGLVDPKDLDLGVFSLAPRNGRFSRTPAPPEGELRGRWGLIGTGMRMRNFLL